VGTEPTVVAVMLTADRPEYARRAVECFRRQTYPAKRLLILDSGVTQLGFEVVDTMRGEFYIRGERGPILPTVGELRNMANGLRHFDEPDIFIHLDDDDWSHPSRFSEQVALLQSSGADCVGYREMLFWREARHVTRYGTHGAYRDEAGEAWLYSNPDPRYCLGTSLCYWRKTWERKPFEATSQGEDDRFITGLNCVGVSAIARQEPAGPGLSCQGVDVVPRMIARIHSGNTSNAYRSVSPGEDRLRLAEIQGSCWKRAVEWDSYVRSVME
jgi:glycosyltransferase involved in cell wall biosynthesis